MFFFPSLTLISDFALKFITRNKSDITNDRAILWSQIKKKFTNVITTWYKNQKQQKKNGLLEKLHV